MQDNWRRIVGKMPGKQSAYEADFLDNPERMDLPEDCSFQIQSVETPQIQVAPYYL